MYGRGNTMVFSADAKSLFMSGHMGLIFWDLDDTKMSQPRNLRVDNLYFHNAGVALSPDGKVVAASSMMGGEQDMPIRFLDSATGKDIRQIENDQRIQGLCFSPDGRSLAVVAPQRIELWDAATGDEVRVFHTAQNTFYQLLTFSPDGKMLAAVANPNRFPPAPEEDAEIHVWETASGKERTCVHLPAPLLREQNPRMNYANRGINGLAFSVDGRFLAVSGNDSAVHMWDLHKDKEAVPLTGFEGNASALIFTPDGKELIALGFTGPGANFNASRLSWPTEEVRRINALRRAPLNKSAFADLWKELAQSDVFRVYRAGRYLLADPKRAIALLNDRLKPVPPGDSARIRKLVADLNNGDPAVRRKAMMELRARHGEAAVGALQQHSDPQRRRFGMTFEQKLANLYNTPERARDLKVVRILEEIGTPEARQALEKLSNGADGVNLTVQAKAALDRLADAKAAPRPAASDNLWVDLGSDDAARAYRAMGRLLSSKPGISGVAAERTIETGGRYRGERTRAATGQPGSRRFPDARTGKCSVGESRGAGGAGPAKGAGRQAYPGGPQTHRTAVGPLDQADARGSSAKSAGHRSAGTRGHGRVQGRSSGPGWRRSAGPDHPRGQGVVAVSDAAMIFRSDPKLRNRRYPGKRRTFRGSDVSFSEGRSTAETPAERGPIVAETGLARLMPPSYTYSFRQPGSLA
jgi:hypothetical protein